MLFQRIQISFRAAAFRGRGGSIIEETTYMNIREYVPASIINFPQPLTAFTHHINGDHA